MIRVYSMPACPYCAELKTILTKEGIEFEDVNIDLPENDAEYQELAKISNSDEVPIIKVGKQLLVPNISFRSIQEAVEITKSFLG